MRRGFGFQALLIFTILSLQQKVWAADEPSSFSQFSSWLWQDQIVPTARETVAPSELSILGAGAAGVILSHQFDPSFEAAWRNNQRLAENTTDWGVFLGSGLAGGGIAVAQLIWDREHGLAHARAIILTSLSTMAISVLAERDRPNHADHFSFPSGHTSSAFATATSLEYAYGPAVGVPAYLLAGFVGLSRVSDNDHWLSDVIGGAALGFFWGRVSAHAGENSARNPAGWEFYPAVSSREASLRASLSF